MIPSLDVDVNWSMYYDFVRVWILAEPDTMEEAIANDHKKLFYDCAIALEGVEICLDEI